MLRDSLPEDLQPLEPTIIRMMRDGLNLYHKRFGHIEATSTIRSVRSNIHDCLAEVGKQTFPYQIKGNLFLLQIGRYLVRPKKFSENLEISNYPTQAVFDFVNQTAYHLFPELAPINLCVGYVPDQFDVRNSTIWIIQTGPDGWEYQFRAEATTTQLPIPSPTDPNALPKSRVKPKRTKLRKVKDTEE